MTIEAATPAGTAASARSLRVARGIRRHGGPRVCYWFGDAFTAR